METAMSPAPVKSRRSMTRNRFGECKSIMLTPEVHEELKAHAHSEEMTLTEAANVVLAIALKRFDLLPELHPLHRPAGS